VHHQIPFSIQNLPQSIVLNFMLQLFTCHETLLDKFSITMRHGVRVGGPYLKKKCFDNIEQYIDVRNSQFRWYNGNASQVYFFRDNDCNLRM
jgi:hypothetical protein